MRSQPSSRRFSQWVSFILAAGICAACQQTRPFDDSMPQSENSPPAPPAASQPEPDAIVAQRLLTDPTRRVLTLTNGFTIILQQNKTAPIVATRVYVRAGALTEQQHMAAGLSHVVEHLVSGASSGKRKEEQNTLLLEQIGNDSNAFTDEDQTCYFITTSADKWQVAMDLLIDCTTDTDFTREQFNREFQVVQRELEMDEAEADRVFYADTQTTRYIKHPARHPVVGYKAAFQKLTYEDAKAYYQQMYVPDNMIISVAGDIDLDAAEKMITGELKEIRRKVVPAIALPPEPQVAVPRTGVSWADVRQARVEWAFPTVDMYSPDLYATDVLASVLGGGESSILVRRLLDKPNPNVVSISCDDPTPWYVEGNLAIDAVLDPAKIPAAQKEVLETLDDLLKNGVPVEDVERAKARASADMIYGDQTAEQQAIRNAEDFMMTANIDFTKQYVQRIQAVTPADVLAAARKYIRTDRLLTTVLLPLDTPNPFAQWPATQASAVAASAVQKTVLKNGLTVLISRNPAAPLASFHLYTLGGMLAENDDNNGIGNAMMQMLTRGTTSRTHQQITDFLDSSGTSLEGESGNNSFSLSVECLKEHAPDAFALLADVALHPKFSQDELDQLRPQLLAAIDQSTEDWFNEAYTATKEVYYLDSPYKRFSVGRTQVVEKLTPADLQKHFQQFFLDPQKTVLAISGDIDPVAAAAWAATFGDISIPATTPSLRLTSTSAEPGTTVRHTEKQSATIMFAFPPGMVVDSPDRYALTLLQTCLGGYSSPFGSMLHETLRGQGLVYDVEAQTFSGPAGGMFLIYTLGEPKNTQKIVDNIKAIVAGAKAGNITDAQIALAKDQAITGQKLSNQTIADKTSAQALDELMGLGYDQDTTFPVRIGAVTKQEVIRVANKYLTDPIIVITTPDAKK